MSESPAGERDFRNQVVRVADLTVNAVELRGYTFSNCRIIGPAVLVPVGRTTISHSDLGPSLEAIFWELNATRQAVSGAIWVVDCTFSACAFVDIGFAGPRELGELLAGSG